MVKARKKEKAEIELLPDGWERLGRLSARQPRADRSIARPNAQRISKEEVRTKQRPSSGQ